MQTVGSAPSETVIRLSTLGEFCEASNAGFQNLRNAQIGYRRVKIAHNFRGTVRCISLASAKAPNSIFSSSKMAGVNSSEFMMMFSNGIKRSGSFYKDVAMKAGGEKGFMDPNAQSVMPDLNSSQSLNSDTVYPPVSIAEKATNIVWQECLVSREERQKLLGQKGCVIWITGLSGSGKSTLACTLSHALHSRGKLAYILDGDNVRHGLNKNLGFSAEDRAENIRRVGEVAKLFVDAGLICIASLISPYRRDRDACRALLPPGEFIEIFMNIPLEICEERDAKGLYKLARAGKIKGFTGIDDPYELPENCEMVMQLISGICPTPKDMGEQVMTYLEEKGFI